MLGAIIGDICGSKYERRKWTGNTWDFELFPREAKFTDDTVMRLGVAEAIMNAKGQQIRQIVSPHGGYGQKFRAWLADGNREPYDSFGNGNAMRVSPVAWAFDNLKDVEKYAKMSSEVTH